MPKDSKITMIFIDLTTFCCPLPLVKVKLALNSLAIGEQLTVSVADPASCKDIPAYLEQKGHKIMELSRSPQKLTFIVTKQN